ncbi:MAG TPA: hypothetical protein VNL77_07865 [Roseiflexaceae bacterium]|nr:hypothetical protein [Roseiflexaceae bacterium]
MADVLDNRRIADGQHRALRDDILIWRDAVAEPAEARMAAEFAAFSDEVFAYAGSRLRESRLDDVGAGMYRRNLSELLQTHWIIARESLHQHGGPRSKILVGLDRAAQGYYERMRRAAPTRLPTARLFVYLDELPALTRLALPGYGWIGVPLFSLTTDTVWEAQAIPHEVAHYMLGVADGLEDELREAFQQALVKSARSPASRAVQIWTDCRDEVICDVLGVLLAGADHADSIQRRILAPRQFMLVGDGRHPPPIVRPLIHIAALRQLAVHLDDDQLRARAGELEARWRDAYPDLEAELYHEQISGAVDLTTVGELLLLVDGVVEAICQTRLRSLDGKSLCDALGGADHQALLPVLSESGGLDMQYWLSARQPTGGQELEGAPPPQIELADLREVDGWFERLQHRSPSVKDVAMPEQREELAHEIAALLQTQELSPAAIRRRLRDWAVLQDLRREGSVLSEEQALQLINAGLALSSLRYIPQNQLAEVLGGDKELSERVRSWAAESDLHVISYDISAGTLAGRRSFIIPLLPIVGVAAAIAVKAVVG